MTQNKSSAVPAGLEAQRNYIAKREAEGARFNLMVAGAFVRGIRDLGYRSNGTALDELFDNSIQAGADKVHIAFGFAKKTDNQPNALAIIDNGHGMDAAMIRVATMWGGTHRENDRQGFGRYGYGLPSACVSMGKRFTVLSWTKDSQVHAVTVDIDDISEGKYRTADGEIVVPEPRVEELPEWIKKYMLDHLGGSIPSSGTVILIEKLDRLKWKTVSALTENLSNHMGAVYRNFMRQVSLGVHGKPVEPVDPLFLTPGARYYGSGEAKALPPMEIEIKHRDGNGSSTIKVRFSYLDPEYFSQAFAKGDSKNLWKARQQVMKEYNGLIVLRHGRLIDAVRYHRDWGLQLMNNDRFWKVEIDFPAELDEDFSIATSKQSVVIGERIWAILRDNGFYRAVKQLRSEVNASLKRLKAEKDDAASGEHRPSEQAMVEAEKLKVRVENQNKPERMARAEQNRRDHAEKTAQLTGMPTPLIEAQLKQEEAVRPYKVEYDDSPGAPFYRVYQRGGQTVLVVNRGHRFYTDVYAADNSNPAVRAGLEVLLFTLGVSELEATEDRQAFYESEKVEWSRRLNVALAKLKGIDVDHPDIVDPDDVAEEKNAA